jgi:hypothetical protein
MGVLFSYIGPGSGLELVGAMIGMLVTLGTSAGFVLLYPIRKFLRSRRRGDAPATEACSTEMIDERIAA